MADVGGVAADRLRSFVERIERLEEEKATIAADIKEVYAEAKGTGFDVKTLRQIIALRTRCWNCTSAPSISYNILLHSGGETRGQTPVTAVAWICRSSANDAEPVKAAATQISGNTLS